MIVLCKKCLGTGDGNSSEILTMGFPGPCHVCGTPDRGNTTAYRTDPRSPLEVLMIEVDEICELLDMYPTLEQYHTALKKLNGARLRYQVAKVRDRLVGAQWTLSTDGTYNMTSVSLICPPESDENKS